MDLRCDCKSVVDYVGTNHVTDDLRCAVQLAQIKEDLEDGVYRSVKHIEGELNYADGMTKKMKPVLRRRFHRLMMLGEVSYMF